MGKRGRSKRVGPEPVDVHVGSRIRLRRTRLGMSQQKLGEAIGLTFQQVQKYEKGTNRVGASRMQQLSDVLDVPVSYFFDEMNGALAAAPATSTRGSDDKDPMVKRETLELVRAYYKITNDKVRKRLFEMTKALAKAA